MRLLRKGEIIRFSAISVLAGDEMEFEGIILGDAKAVKKFWPEEMGELGADEACYLVKREDNFGNDFHHCVFVNEILEVVATNEKEAS